MARSALYSERRLRHPVHVKTPALSCAKRSVYLETNGGLVKKFVAVCAAMMAVGLFGLAFATPASADPQNSNSHAIIVRPGHSIQAAINAARPGTTIVVKPGTYAENLTITTDGITLLGHGATLVPPATSQPNFCSDPDPATDGICAVGQFDLSDPNNPVVVDPLDNVTISGLTISDFPGSGVLFFGAHNPNVIGVHALGNGEYGIARFISTGGKIVGSVATDSAEAGIYVGDSPNANVLLAANEVSGNLFGFFLRDSGHGKVVGNRSHDNCLGLLNLNTGSNQAGNYAIFGNKISHNNKLCPADPEEDTPPLSGIGIAIVNGHENTVRGNRITNNVPSGDSAFSGGVVVVDLGGGVEAPFGNRISSNVILNNQPDILWDGSGTGNVFTHNHCQTSEPSGLC
jgi:parallel beta-helix repeat protein